VKERRKERGSERKEERKTRKGRMKRRKKKRKKKRRRKKKIRRGEGSTGEGRRGGVGERKGMCKKQRRYKILNKI